MSSIFIKRATWLVTLDQERRIIRDGALAIEDENIVEVGKSDDLSRKHNNKEFVIDAKNKLVLPGLIDGHVHNSQHLAKGLADEVDIMAWLYDRVYPCEAAMTKEDAYVGSLLCQLEMIKAGTTCFFDPGGYYPEQVVEAMRKSGMRGIVSRSALDLYETESESVPTKLFRESTDETLRNGEEFVNKYNGSLNGRVKGSFALRRLTDCSDELCIRTDELSRKYNVKIQTHGDASVGSAQVSKKKFGSTGVERLHKLGVLGRNVLMIHMGGITPKGMMLMQKTNATGVSCPVSSAHLGDSTSMYLPEMLDLGLDICLGSDSGPNGNFLDVVRAMNFAALSTKRDRNDPAVLPPESLLEMATINAARVGLSGSETGSLEVGKKADVSIFDVSRPEWRPVHNPIANLVYCGSGASADTVIVDGAILMENKVAKTLDEAELIEKGQEASNSIADRSGVALKARPLWPMI